MESMYKVERGSQTSRRDEAFVWTSNAVYFSPNLDIKGQRFQKGTLTQRNIIIYIVRPWHVQDNVRARESPTP